MLTHEYFHVLQGQLAGVAGGRSQLGSWLVEGVANWAMDEHRMTESSEGWQGWIQSMVSASTPTLRSTERNNAGWQYRLGFLASRQLATIAGSDSWIEFWRRLVSTGVGPQYRWLSTPDWQTVFFDVFGVALSSFYTNFSAWQQQLAEANATTANSTGLYWYDKAWWIRGRITDVSNTSVARTSITATKVEGENDIGPLDINHASPADDGSFAVRAPSDGKYHLSVNTDGCTRYYSNGALVKEQGNASLISVAGADIANINIHLPLNVCGWQIRGRIVGPNAEPLVGIRVTACPTDGSGQCHSSASAGDGSFAVTVDKSDEYRVHANLSDSCSAYFRAGVPTTNSNSASPITVADGHVDGLLMHVPEGMCAYQIRGSIAQADGQPLTDTRVSVCLEVNGECTSYAGGDTDDDGAFAITVPEEGVYRINFDLDGCTIYFRHGGLTTNSNEQGTVTISGRNVRLIPRQISEGMCVHRISGRFVDSSGAPLSEKWINAFGAGGSGGVWTDAAGRFEIRVPSNGAYTFGIQLRSQPYCWRYLAGRALGSPNNPVRVSGADVTGIMLRLPGTIEELCK